jgi:hypothetical protein
MPSLPTLFSYTRRTKWKVGITNVIEERLKLLFNLLVEDHEKKISVEIDEMACRALMMWIQSRQEFVGEVDFGELDVDEIIEDVYNESEDDEVCEKVGKGIDVDGGKISEGAVCLQDEHTEEACHSRKPVLANSLINFMMTGLTTKFNALVGSWSVAKLTGP